jgi:hypothetical protein
MKPKQYSRRKIEDEFSHLPVSRGRKYQLRRHKEGRCIKCGQPQAAAYLCLRHLIANREAIRRKAGATRRNRSLSYALEAKAKAKAARRPRVRRVAKKRRR